MQRKGHDRTADDLISEANSNVIIGKTGKDKKVPG